VVDHTKQNIWRTQRRRNSYPMRTGYLMLMKDNDNY